MLDAIGEAWIHRGPAEVEIRFARVAHRPTTYLVAKIQKAGLVCNIRAWLGRNKAAWRRRRYRGLLVAWSLTQEATWPD